jgi:hypothetical protein
MWGVNDVPEDPEKGHIGVHSENLIRMAISLVCIIYGVGSPNQYRH